MADDARQVAQLLRMHYPGVPLYGLGESMGGAVLLLALARHPPGWIDAAVVLAPAVLEPAPDALVRTKRLVAIGSRNAGDASVVAPRGKDTFR